ncbi:PPAP2A family protein [Megaselia abdita]
MILTLVLTPSPLTSDMPQFTKFKNLVKICLDITLLIALGAAFLRVEKFVKPFQSGYFCDDHSLKYSLKEDTFGFGLLTILSIALPIGVIVVLDVFKNRSSFKSAIKEIYKSIIFFAYGFLAHTILLSVLKKSIGRLRPFFHEVCQPALPEGLQCSNNTYIYDYICSNENVPPRLLIEIYQSFPSGHASFIVYGMTFLVLYLEFRVKYKWSILLKAVFQLICILLAVVVCSSRITDNWHHLTDVVAGAIIGLVFALWSIYLRFRSNRKSGDLLVN